MSAFSRVKNSNIMPLNTIFMNLYKSRTDTLAQSCRKIRVIHTENASAMREASEIMKCLICLSIEKRQIFTEMSKNLRSPTFATLMTVTHSISKGISLHCEATSTASIGEKSIDVFPVIYINVTCDFRLI